MATDRSDAAVLEAKRSLRRRLLDRRAARAPAPGVAAATALRDRVLALPEVAAATTLACYVSLPQEPGTGPLLDALTGAGVTVLLPVLLPDADLDWAAHRPGDLAAGRLGLQEPSGPRLGPDAVRQAGVIVCPGLAVDRVGHRLGRGGGSYDRALARLPASALRVVLLYDDEVLDAVPVDDHDELVHVAVTPSATLTLDSAAVRRSTANPATASRPSGAASSSPPPPPAPQGH